MLCKIFVSFLPLLIFYKLKTAYYKIFSFFSSFRLKLLMHGNIFA